MEDAKAEGKPCQCCVPPGRVVAFIFCAAGAVHVFVTNPHCLLFNVIAETPVSKSGQGYSGAPRIQRQEQVIHLSPKKGSQVRIKSFFVNPPDGIVCSQSPAVSFCLLNDHFHMAQSSYYDIAI